MTAASPGIVALTLANRYYDSHEDYVFALAEELRKEYEIIVANGLTLQLDCPDLAMERHISYQDEPLSAFRDLVALHIRAINYALSNIPADQVRLHVCWGNNEAPHIYDVPLEDIIDLLYEANVGALVMEMANPRHGHEHRVYRNHTLPEGMLLVAGVIDTKTNYVEHPPAGGGPGASSCDRCRRRPHAGDGRDRLRLRHLCRVKPGGRRHRVAEASVNARRSGYSQPRAVLEIRPVSDLSLVSGCAWQSSTACTEPEWRHITSRARERRGF